MAKMTCGAEGEKDTWRWARQTGAAEMTEAMNVSQVRLRREHARDCCSESSAYLTDPLYVVLISRRSMR